MGMSTHIQAYINDDDVTYRKHAKVLKACAEAEISLPKETAEYFNVSVQESSLYLLDEKLEIEIPFSEYSDDSSEGYEILIKDIPQGTYKIRFTNSW